MPNLTTSQVVALTGKHRRQLRRMIDDGRLIPLEKLPGVTGAYLFDAAEIERVFGVKPEVAA